MFYIHWDLAAGSRAELPADHAERAVFVVQGEIAVEGRSYGTGQMIVFAPGPAMITATTPSLVLALGGEPLGPRFIEWNFVSSRQERIEQAKADWRAGRMKLPDLDHEEFIPLPEPPPPPNQKP